MFRLSLQRSSGNSCVRIKCCKILISDVLCGFLEFEENEKKCVSFLYNCSQFFNHKHNLKTMSVKPTPVLFSCSKSRFLCVVVSTTLQRGLTALPLKISSLHVERTKCELKSQPAPETLEEWSFRRKQQHWGFGVSSQSPFYGAPNKRVTLSFSYARLSEGHSRPVRI